MSFPRAKKIYEKDKDFEKKHRQAYVTRHKPIKLFAFILLVMLIGILVFLIALNNGRNIVLIVPIAVIVSLIAREIYYSEISFRLKHTKNRISAFMSRPDVDENGNQIECQQIDFAVASSDSVPEMDFNTIIKELIAENDEQSKADSKEDPQPKKGLPDSEVSPQTGEAEAENPYGFFVPPEQKQVVIEETNDKPSPQSDMSLIECDRLLDDIAKKIGLEF